MLTGLKISRELILTSSNNECVTDGSHYGLKLRSINVSTGQTMFLDISISIKTFSLNGISSKLRLLWALTSSICPGFNVLCWHHAVNTPSTVWFNDWRVVVNSVTDLLTPSRAAYPEIFTHYVHSSMYTTVPIPMKQTWRIWVFKGYVSLDPSKISKSGWWGLQLDKWQLCNSLWYGLINSKLHINKNHFL